MGASPIPTDYTKNLQIFIIFLMRKGYTEKMIK
jgi:hypothetical protein